MRRVVITGMGMVSSLGNNVATSWEALIAGKSGIEQFINDPVLKNSHPYNLALVKNFDYKKWKVPVYYILFSMQQIE
jgi:3-oxoacyl-[acyl-carrier-protein] synthase II